MQEPRSVTFESESSGLRVIDAEYPPDTDFETHTHEEAYAVLVVRGSYVEWRPKKRVVHGGHDQVWRPGSRHAVRTGPTPVRLLHVAHPTDEDLVTHPLRVGLLWQIAASLESDGEAVDEPVGLLHVESLIAELVDGGEASAEPDARPPYRVDGLWLDRVRSRLREGYRDQPSLAELASEVERHPSHLVRAFRRRWGMTPGEYLRRVRVAQAVRLLREDDVALSTVAFSVGFADQSHMGRWVRRYTGATPGALREADPETAG